jgi:hypothetical protein
LSASETLGRVAAGIEQSRASLIVEKLAMPDIVGKWIFEVGSWKGVIEFETTAGLQGPKCYWAETNGGRRHYGWWVFSDWDTALLTFQFDDDHPNPNKRRLFSANCDYGSQIFIFTGTYKNPGWPDGGFRVSKAGPPIPAVLNLGGILIAAFPALVIDNFLNGVASGAQGKVPPDLLSQLNTKIASDYVGFQIGYANGCRFGLWQGAKNAWHAAGGLWDMEKAWASFFPRALYSVYQKVQQEPLLLLTDAAHRELRSYQYKEAKAVVKITEYFANDVITHPKDYLMLSFEIGAALGQSAGTWFTNDFSQRSASQIGETLGGVIGQVLFEIFIWAITSGIAAAARAAGEGAKAARAGLAIGEGAEGGGRIAGLVRRLQAVLEGLPGIRKLKTILADERWVERWASLTTKELEAVVGGERQTIVEIGAGDLKASIGLAKKGGVRVVAVDPVAPSAAAVEELEGLGGEFVQGVATSVPAGTADHVYQYFPWRITGTGSHIEGGTWRLVQDTITLLKPGGAAHFVTEEKATAEFLAGEAAKHGLRAVITDTTAGAAAPGASGAGVPAFAKGLKVWMVNIYK